MAACDVISPRRYAILQYLKLVNHEQKEQKWIQLLVHYIAVKSDYNSHTQIVASSISTNSQLNWEFSTQLGRPLISSQLNWEDL